MKSQPLNRHVAIAVSRPLLVVASAFHSLRCRNSACSQAIFCQFFSFDKEKSGCRSTRKKCVRKMRKIDKALDEMLSTFAHTREHDIHGRAVHVAQPSMAEPQNRPGARMTKFLGRNARWFCAVWQAPHIYGAKNTPSDRSKSYRRHTWQNSIGRERKTNNVHMLKCARAPAT